MTQFGSELKRLRMERNWRQRDLVDALDGQMARSTLANVEAGRERPTVRLWTLIGRYLPDWRAELEPSYLSARALQPQAHAARPAMHNGEPHPGGGPFLVESLQFVHTFGPGRSPVEIIEVRRVRALQTGVREYGLVFTDALEEARTVEALWGGYLTGPRYVETDHEVQHLRQFRFGRRLRRGETHDFALRAVVAPVLEPESEVRFRVALPTEYAAIHLNFTGSERPVELWSWGPATDADISHDPARDGRLLTPSAGGNISARFARPVQGAHYGISWEW